MNLDNLSDLPDWDDMDSFSNNEEGEEWKPDPTTDSCKILYKQWQQVVFLMKGFLSQFYETEGSEDIEEQMLVDTARIIHGDAHIVGVKIRTSGTGDLYVLRMENAAIIRQLAQSIASELLLFVSDKRVDKNYIVIVRQEIDKFRELFIDWVNTFEKDEFKDEWGLFV
jgi:hypothetical protein